MRLFHLGALATAAAVACVSLFTGPAAHAEDAASFYKGKRITWIVPYRPGGGYDEYSRLIMPYLEKYTGATFELQNMPGAGGMKGANEIFNAPADGLTLGIINGSALVTNELAEIEGARYKVAEYGFLGRMNQDLRVLAVATATPYHTFDDILDANSPVLLGATGLGGSTYVDGVITGKVFGIDQKIIHGFNSSTDIRQALLRGDIHGMWGSYGSALSSIKDGELRVVVQGDKERNPLLPDVASTFEYVAKKAKIENADAIMKAWDALNAVGRPVAGPPGIPADRLAFLRDAFDKAMHDPEMVAIAQKSERDLGYASGEEMEGIAKDATDMPPDVKALFVQAIRGEI